MTFSAKSSPPLPSYHPSTMSNTNTEAELLSVALSKSINKPVESWGCSEVSQFIIQLLQLPKVVGYDIINFINLNNIDGTKLLTLDEGSLSKLGFNRLWCYHLGSAIEDLIEDRENYVKPTPTQSENKIIPNKLEVKPIPTVVKSLGKRGGHRLKESIASIKQVGALAQPNQNITTSTNIIASKPFTLPQLELTLLKHFMLSETYGFKAELINIKRQLKLNSEKEAGDKSSIPSTNFEPKFDDNKRGGSWYDYFKTNPTLPVILSTVIICTFLYKRVHPR